MIDPAAQSGDQGAAATVALVLTHNAPASLRRCLAAIASQTTPPGAVLLVDNASDPPVDQAKLDVGLPIRIVRSETNLGPAGGWAIALSDFLADAFDFAWVMDDDIVPERECLARLHDQAAESPEPAFVFPYARQPDGTVGQWGSWCAFLIAKNIVKEVGVPRAELFWSAEDTEYCHWRIPNAGHPRVIAEEALVRHDAIRQGTGVPTWKYYYETRNVIYLHLHIMRRLGWFPRNFTRLMGRAVLRERGGHLGRLWAITLGAYDGIVGSLGIRYPVAPMKERGGARSDASLDETPAR